MLAAMAGTGCWCYLGWACRLVNRLTAPLRAPGAAAVTRSCQVIPLQPHTTFPSPAAPAEPTTQARKLTSLLCTPSAPSERLPARARRQCQTAVRTTTRITRKLSTVDLGSYMCGTDRSGSADQKVVVYSAPYQKPPGASTCRELGTSVPIAVLLPQWPLSGLPA